MLHAHFCSYAIYLNPHALLSIDLVVIMMSLLISGERDRWISKEIV